MSLTLNGTSGIASPGGDTSTSLSTSTITTSGNVGIGQAAAARLSVSNNAGGATGNIHMDANVTAGNGYSAYITVTDAGVMYNTNSTIRGHKFQLNSVTMFTVEPSGAIYTGSSSQSPYNKTTGNAANMYVDTNGALYRSTSSLKYKTDVKDAEHGLSEVMALRPVTYKSKTDGQQIFGGLIAEEVDAAGLTEFVQYAEDGTPDALAYGNMVSLCIKAIQEQQVQIETLAAKVAALENK